MVDQTDDEKEDADTLKVEGEPKSSARILSTLKKAERSFNAWQALCDRIDDVYSRESYYDTVGESSWIDPEYDLFWASMEIMKPAVYARPPKPVVSPFFKDRSALRNVTAEVLERSVTSDFSRVGIDEAMKCVRDDLIFYNRGQLWATYETDEKGGGQRVCIEHLDRKDFLHGLARKWCDVPWVARRAWMTKTELRKRFKKHSGDAYKAATYHEPERDNSENDVGDYSKKAGVWEVWHKADDKVYWVCDGVSVLLDEDKPHLDLKGYFPCPKPAYGTLRPRTLKPVPDYVRYAGHFQKINSLTRRIYDLLDMVRMKGLIPAGGDIGDAVEQVMKDDDNSSMLIPVPSAALISSSSGASGFVQWLPLNEIAEAITGLISARRELFSDYDRLSGISDIMRGETEAEETLGAQQLKSQYGSVRVKDKIDELQRIARDVTEIASEIMAENFSQDTLLEMSQMEIPTKAEIAKRVKELESAAKEELKGLREQAQQAQQSGHQVDPQQVSQQVQQAQQQVVAKYAPMLKQFSEQVSIEAVMKLLRDDKARNFAFEIETDSTVLTDELQEKSQRNEFLTVFTGASQGLMGLASLGEPGAKLAGEVLKFVLQPYRVGRSLNTVIDEFIQAAPQMAAAANGEGSGEAEKALAEANKKLADAEMEKAKAANMKVQTDAAGKQQELQAQIAKLQQEGREKEFKASVEVETLRGKLAEQDAKINLMQAQTAEILSKIGLDVRKQDLEEYKAAADTQLRAQDQAQSAVDSERQAVMSERQQSHNEMQGERQEGRADRQQSHTEQQSNRAENRADRQQAYSERSNDRQQAFAERQAAKEPA